MGAFNGLESEVCYGLARARIWLKTAKSDGLGRSERSPEGVYKTWKGLK